MVSLVLHQWPHLRPLQYRVGSYAWWPLFLTLEVREDLKLALHSQRTEGSIDEHEIPFGHLKTFVIITFCNTFYNNFSRHFLSLNACKVYAYYQKV